MRAVMGEFAELTVFAREAMLKGDFTLLSKLMDRNFDTRCKIYQISRMNMEIIKMARSIGASAKFSGSGGAIIGIYQDEDMYIKLEQELKKLNTIVFKPRLE